jgi:hypothetical protein
MESAHAAFSKSYRPAPHLTRTARSFAFVTRSTPVKLPRPSVKNPVTAHEDAEAVRRQDASHTIVSCIDSPLALLNVVPLATLVIPSAAVRLQLAANQTRVNCPASTAVSRSVSGGRACSDIAPRSSSSLTIGLLPSIEDGLPPCARRGRTSRRASPLGEGGRREWPSYAAEPVVGNRE